MAKSKRKRKIKEQDFKKVKLKVGKRLPKGQNVTDATFKSRSIVLPGQMSKDGTPTNQRKQTLKVQYRSRFANIANIANGLKSVPQHRQRLKFQSSTSMSQIASVYSSPTSDSHLIIPNISNVY